MLQETLERKFGRNNPIFLEEVFLALPEYSRQSVYRFIAKSLEEGELAKFDKGVYYLPKKTEFGIASPSVERVVERKYVRDGENVFGIYGRLSLEERFGLTSQIPNAIEVITNNASRAVREVDIKGRKILLRKSRMAITKENHAAYSLLELFSFLDLKQWRKRNQELVKGYVEEEGIALADIISMATYFPAKAMKNLALSGMLHEAIRE